MIEYRYHDFKFGGSSKTEPIFLEDIYFSDAKFGNQQKIFQKPRNSSKQTETIIH